MSKAVGHKDMQEPCICLTRAPDNTIDFDFASHLTNSKLLQSLKKISLLLYILRPLGICTSLVSQRSVLAPKRRMTLAGQPASRHRNNFLTTWHFPGIRSLDSEGTIVVPWPHYHPRPSKASDCMALIWHVCIVWLVLQEPLPVPHVSCVRLGPTQQDQVCRKNLTWAYSCIH